MSFNSIDFANASQFMGSDGILANGNAMVSGMTAQEAYTALGMQQTGNLATAIQFNQAGSNAVLQFPNITDPADAVLEFEASGGLASNANAALTGSGAVSAGTVGLANINGTMTTVGVATGTAGCFVAGCAPVFGVALGEILYRSDPSFWETVSRNLLPEFYFATETLPIIFDELGNTYLHKEAITAIREYMSNLRYYSACTSSPIGALPSSPMLFTTTKGIYYLNGTIKRVVEAPENGAVGLFNEYPEGGTVSIVFASRDSDSGLGSQYVFNDKTAYYDVVRALGSTASQYIAPYGGVASIIQSTGGPIAWAMLYGECTYQTPGVEKWQGNPYPENPNTIQVLSGLDAQGNPQYEEYQQVAMPIGDPLTTNDPAVQPSPYTNPLPEIDPDTGIEIYPAIDPYINPYPSPSEFPEPNDIPEGEPGHIGDPNLNPAPLPSVEVVPQPSVETLPSPDVDPSAETDPAPEDPEELPQPTSTGTSGTPTLPLVPLFPTSAAGLYHVYNPTNAQLQDFGSWLWTTFSGNLIDTLSKLFNNPMDAVISLQEFYGNPNISGSGTIRCGYLDSQVPSDLVGNRYNTIECGTIIVPEYYGNYLDYAPYSQVICYLPFIGFMSLNADDIIGNAVNIRYHVDSYTGSCIAIITVARNGYSSVLYQFEGNCSVDVPVTGGQQSSIKGAIIGGISGAVMGGVAGAAVGAVMGGLSTKNDVQHSGSFSASYGAMGAKKPFIVVRRPVQKIVLNYNESYGYPAHKMVYVGNCRGYMRAREVRVLSTKATNVEKAMINDYLLSGVYVKD